MTINNSVTFKLFNTISSEEEVFNVLLKVKHMTTKEVGYLLCSHCCKWPEILLPEATWIEGCFTPENFKKDPRLALGYHPHSTTIWTMEGDLLTLKEYYPVQEVFHIDFWPGANISEETEIIYSHERYFERIWNGVRRNREEWSAALAYFGIMDSIWERLPEGDRFLAYAVFFREAEENEYLFLRPPF